MLEALRYKLCSLLWLDWAKEDKTFSEILKTQDYMPFHICTAAFLVLCSKMSQRMYQLVGAMTCNSKVLELATSSLQKTLSCQLQLLGSKFPSKWTINQFRQWEMWVIRAETGISIKIHILFTCTLRWCELTGAEVEPLNLKCFECRVYRSQRNFCLMALRGFAYIEVNGDKNPTCLFVY